MWLKAGEVDQMPKKKTSTKFWIKTLDLNKFSKLMTSIQTSFPNIWNHLTLSPTRTKTEAPPGAKRRILLHIRTQMESRCILTNFSQNSKKWLRNLYKIQFQTINSIITLNSQTLGLTLNHRKEICNILN
jgi:hypothetical protein